MFTNFGALTSNQKTIWSKDMWKFARNMSFINKFAGTGTNSVVQRVTELKKDEKGTRAVITLIADLLGDGTAGDNQLEGNEEPVKSFEQVIRIDQIRHANVHQGRLAEQKSVVSFRETSRDVLAYWLADRIDQMAFLTMAGITYDNRNIGGTRPVGSQLAALEFAADVSAPTAARYRRWDASTGNLLAGNTASVAATDTPSYKMIVALKAYARTQYIRGVRGPGGEEFYHLFLTPQGMAKLKLDPDFLANVRNAGVRGDSNTLFAGTGQSVLVDGVLVHEFRHVFNTSGIAGGSKWGGGAVDGQAAIFAGAQALGMADIGDAYWDEKEFDYNNRPGIAIGKMFGYLKPKFYSNYTGTVEDFGLIRVDTAI